MSEMRWVTYTFRQLALDTLFEILKLRVNVFVVEQVCAYSEIEEWDRHGETFHVCGRTEQEKLVAYARLLPPGLRYPEVNLGRVVVRKEFRGQGVGHLLLRRSLDEIQRYWPNVDTKISAQEYLQGFYAGYGFVPISEVYLEDGVPHIEMVKRVS